MSAYVIATYEIVDPEAYEPYPPGVMEVLEKHGAEILVADFDAEALEGERRSVYVVLRFPSAQSARDWYADPEYQPLKEVRGGSCARNHLVLAEEFVGPES